MGEAYNTLKARLADYTHLQQAGSLLSWDQETYMPAGAGRVALHNAATAIQAFPGGAGSV